MKIKTSLKLNVAPGSKPTSLFFGFGYACEEARRSYRPALARDPYDIAVDLLSPGEYQTFDSALSAVDTFGYRRQLTLVELLCLSWTKPEIRGMSPVFAGGFVLEYAQTEYDELKNESKHVWCINTDTFHRASVLPESAVFATTQLTAVDMGRFTQKYLERTKFQALLKQDPRPTA